MAVAPRPFIKKCTQCSWSKKFYPKSDVVDISWGIEYVKCPNCGADIIQIPIDETALNSVVDSIIDIFKK